MSQEKMGPFLSTLREIGELYKFDQEGYIAPLKEDSEAFELRPYRGVDSVKHLLFPPVKEVARYPGKKEELPEPPKRVIIDAKACDVEALAVFKKIYLDDPDFVDPFIKKVFDSLFIVAADCTDCLSTCFCNLVGYKPYPQSGFDLSLAKVEDGYLVTVGSSKGEDFLKRYSLPEAPKDKIEAVENARKQLFDKVDKQNEEYKTENEYYSIVKNLYYGEGWTHAASCVSCGACTNVCPTCYCFGLADYAVGEKEFSRIMNWDSCQFAGFSRMAGALNPRSTHKQHFQHRFNHKFHHFKERNDFYACTGCGRCTEACLGKIDIREVLKRVETESKNAKVEGEE